MPDGVPITAGAGTTVATDLIGGVHFQRVKATFGVDGAAVDVSASDPFPVTGTFFQTTQPVSLAAPVAVTGTFWQATQPVSGTVTANAGTGTFAVSAASLPLPTGAATSAKQDTLVALLPASLGQKAKAASLAVAIASDQDTLAVSGSATVAISTSFTRPADTTAYTSGDLVANNTTAGSVVVLSFANAARVASGSGMVRRARLRKSGTSVTNSSFRIHLFNAAPATITNGDNGAFSVSGAADYIGAIDVSVDRAFTDGAVGTGIPVVGSEINFKLPSGSTIYGVIEARGAYTPTSAETIAVTLEILQD